ncbi:cupin domain-containing protein [Aquibacillus saliphilus]|uniref:cupin domain-containing protein n=1 Tax=Aquibacillus saliphilus TaxID=1909422 RepID=UPI001CEFCE2B|nr:cupin domain-containing protein [Aquibacillus saliphilus]
MKKQNLSEYIEFSEERFTKRVVFKEGQSTVFLLNFKPGQSLPAHKHPGTNVYLQLLQGEGTFTFDGEKVAVTKDDILVAGGDEELSFANDGSSNVSLYVMLNKIPDDSYAKDV